MFEHQKLPRGSITSRIASKWGEQVLDEGYVVFPKRLMRCLPAIFGATKGIKELQVALAIADFLRPNLGRGPSLEFLSFSTGLDVSELKQLLTGLKAKGLINYKGTEDELAINNEGLRERILDETRENEDPKQAEDDDEELDF
jgi:hypothetical protein